MHPVRDFKINDLEFADQWAQKYVSVTSFTFGFKHKFGNSREALSKAMKLSKCHHCPKLKEQAKISLTT